MKYNKNIILFSILIILLNNCSNKPPEIIQTFWQINIFNNRETEETYQKLSLFIHVDDPDGFDDIETLYLINDKEELFWSLDTDSWQKSSNNNETWLGTNGFTMPDYSPFPTGEYRLLLQDLGGKDDEKVIYVKSKNIPTSTIKFGTSIIEDQKLTISNSYENNEIWIYATNWRFISSYSIKQEVLLPDLFNIVQQIEHGFNYYLYSYDEINDIGIINGPFFYTNTE